MLASDQIAAFYIDVNAVDDHGRVGTTFAAAVADLDLQRVDLSHGAKVRAVDADDNVCEAIIVDRKADWLEFQLDQDTWQPLAAARGHQDMRFSLASVDPEDALRALLQTPPPARD